MATTISTLKFMITADAGGLVSGVALTKKELREAAKIVDSTTPQWQQYSEQIERLKHLHAGGGLDAAQYRTALAAVRSEMVSGIPIVGGLVSSLTPLNVATGAAAVGFGALAAAAGTAIAVIGERITALDEMADTSERLGMSIESLSRMRAGAVLAGMDPTAMDSAVQKLLVNVGKGSEAITKLGLDVNALRQMQDEQIVGVVATKIAELPTHAERIAAASELFGKNNSAMLVYGQRLDEINAAVERSGAVVSNELGERIAAIGDAFDELRLNAEGFANALTSLASGPIMAALDNMQATLRLSAGAAATIVGGAGAGLAGGNAVDMAAMAIDAERERIAQQREQARKDAGNSIDVALALDEETQARKAAGKSTSDHGAEVDKMIAKLREEAETYGMSAAALARYRAEKAGATREQADFIEAVTAEQEALREAEARRREVARMDEEIGREALRERESLERKAKAIADGLRTPEESIRDRVREEAATLQGAGLLTEVELGRIVARGARDIARLDSGGAVFANAAQKGTAAAREAVIRSDAATKQVAKLTEIAATLKAMLSKPGIEVEELVGL